MDQIEILKKLKEAKPELEKNYGLKSLALFGSYSRGEQGQGSDIDLLIDLSDVNASNFFNCAFLLQDMFKNKKVEVVVHSALKPRYYEAIKQDLLYA